MRMMGPIQGNIKAMAERVLISLEDVTLSFGGKPLFTPLFAFPVSYEMTILLSAFGTLFGMFFLNQLPKFYNPLFKNERFKKSTDDRFFICI
ncbi:MAG: DUF3341 domain-containing protein, partial [Proteobacteria bacterium]|nr:DUF3341 domain-containing protein [Pseudomonadota bacterium]